jgi:hypothetical protein
MRALAGLGTAGGEPRWASEQHNGGQLRAGDAIMREGAATKCGRTGRPTSHHDCATAFDLASALPMVRS